jgi:PAS domain S-box-containing protein
MRNNIPSDDLQRDTSKTVANDPVRNSTRAVSATPDTDADENNGYTRLNESRVAVRQTVDVIAPKATQVKIPSGYIMEINQLPFPSLICDTEATIIKANTGFYELTGFSEAEYTGKPLKDLIASGSNEAVLPLLAEFNHQGKDTLKTELLLNTTGKAKKYVLLQSQLIRDSAGVASQILVQLVDLTQRNESQELLKKRSDELEKFVYSTSHDLRAPLRSIMGLIFIIQQEKDQAAISTYLDMIRSSVNRMDNFIKELVDISRNSRQPINKEEINLEETVTEIFDSLRFIPGAEKIEFILNVKQDRPFYSDSGRVKVILNNLISNAIAYHRTGQENPYIKVQVNVTNKYCHIEVIDNGRGIQKEHQAKIFDMFYRASDDSKGSGLGLYIVKEAVNKLNGDIRIKSTWGEGSTFSLKFFNLAP